MNQVRQVLEQAKPREPADRSAFAWYDWNALALAPPILDQSPRARAIREIEHIAARYQWGMAITRALDGARVSALTDLGDESLDALAAQMRRYVDCGMFACDPEDELTPR